MKDRINSYFAILLVTIAGSVATLIIIRVVYDANTFFLIGGEENYASLQQSILQP